MKHRVFTTVDVMRSLGLAPSTASVVASLLNGDVDPDNFRSVQVWAMKQFGNLPPQVDKVLVALCSILESDLPTFSSFLEAGKGGIVKFVDLGDQGLPTVIWDEGRQQFCLNSMEDHLRNR